MKEALCSRCKDTGQNSVWECFANNGWASVETSIRMSNLCEKTVVVGLLGGLPITWQGIA